MKGSMKNTMRNVDVAKENKKTLLNKLKAVEIANELTAALDGETVAEFGDMDLKKIEKLERELSEYKKKLKSTDAERKKNAKALEKRTSELKIVKKENKELENLIRELTKKLDVTEGELKSESDLVGKLSVDVDCLTSMVTSANAKITSLNNTISDLEKLETSELIYEIKQLKRELFEKDNELKLMTKSRDQLNTKHVKKMSEYADYKDMTKKELANFDKRIKLVDKEKVELRLRNDRLTNRLQVMGTRLKDLNHWTETDRRDMLRNIDKNLFMDALVYRIRNDEGFKIPADLRKRFEEDVYFEELKRAKRDMALINLSNAKTPGFERLTSVGVLLDFGDDTFGFRNINNDMEHRHVDLAGIEDGVCDGAVVRVEVLSDGSVRLVEVYKSTRGDKFYEAVAKRRKKSVASRNDGFGLSVDLKNRLDELLEGKRVVMISSNYRNTEREYLSKHITGIEMIDAYEEGDRKVNSAVLGSDICIIRPDKVPHSVVSVIEDKKDDKYVWANSVNPRELVGMLFNHLVTK